MFNILVAGDNKVGKTSFINSFTNIKFSEIHVPSKPLVESTLKLSTSGGNVTLNITEIADYEKIPFLYNLHGAILIFDLTDTEGFDRIKEWYADIKKHFPTIPIIICGNKSDIKNPEPEEYKNKYTPMSVKNRYNSYFVIKQLFMNFSHKYMDDIYPFDSNLEEKVQDSKPFPGMKYTLQLLLSDTLKTNKLLLDINDIQNGENLSFKYKDQEYIIHITKKN